MGYRVMGRAHATGLRAQARLAAARARALDTTGQGTVEYVALILLVAALMAGVLAVAGGLKGGGIAETVAKRLKETIEGVGADKR
jgi:hypothetical protein